VSLLVVEDEAGIASFLTKGLSEKGYGVSSVATGADALARIRDPDLDLVILDLGLADMDGLEVLRELRGEGRSLPVIILTARGEVEDLLEGFDLGADDYLTKPFAFDELVARIGVRLRGRNDLPATYVGGVRIDRRTLRVEIGRESVALTPREFALTEAFLRHPGEVVAREQLLWEVWGLRFDPGTNIVDSYIRYLRRKLGEKRIETVRGVGYRFCPDGC
jgi:DNA-binding response OmpR family regulator